MRKPRVVWTEEEMKRVADEILRLRIKDVTAGIVPLAQQAQAVLPPERQKTLTGVHALKELIPLVQTKMESLTLKADQEPHQEDEPAVFIEIEKEVQPDRTKILADATTEELAAILIPRMCSYFRRLEEGLAFRQQGNANTQMAMLPRPLPVPEEKPKKRTRIAIVGLLSDQQQAVVEKTKGRPVDLRFIDSSRSDTSIPPTVEYVIIDKHAGHRWYESAKNKYPSDRVLFSDGGTSAVVQRVMDIASRQ